jgi:ubiquinone/menaquinone biosynthesis C-methylase UbiE
MEYPSIRLYNGLAMQDDLENENFTKLSASLRKLETGPGLGGWHKHWARQWEFPFIFRALVEMSRNRTGDISILESGCGFTVVPFWLAANGFKVTGVDMDGNLKEKWENTVIPCSDKNNYRFVAGDMENLPFPGSSFDGVYSISAIEHTNHPLQSVKEMIRIVRPGGIIAFTMDMDIKNSDSVNQETMINIQEYLIENCKASFPVLHSSPSKLITISNRPENRESMWLKKTIKGIGEATGLYNPPDQGIFVYLGLKNQAV